MKPERQFWGWVLLLAVGMLLLVGGQAWLFYMNHGGELSALPFGLRVNLLTFLGLALLSLLPFLVWGMRSWYRRYVLPVHRITESVEALVYGSHHARLPEEADDPSGLTPLLNALMERYQQGEEMVEHRLEAALGELSEEKTRLESLLEALSEGVVVYSTEGRVLRYNRAARTLFRHRELGVGKPVIGLVETSVLDYARETLQQQLATGVRHPFTSFHCNSTPEELPLRARIAPLLVYGGRLGGFVLTVEPEEHGATAMMAATLPAGAASSAQAAGAGPVAAPAAARSRGQALADLRYVVLDTETTGLHPEKGDEVISLGALVVLEGRILPGEAFDRLLRPGRPISRAARRVHGIGEESLAGCPTLAEVLPEFARFAKGAVLVAHHAAFDLSFLHRAAEAVGMTLEQPVLDTMLLSAVLHPNQPSHSLDTLLARYGVRIAGRHSALGDARMTAELLLRLLPQLERRGIFTLEAAQEASRRTALAKVTFE